jgi:hypothetical protein
MGGLARILFGQTNLSMEILRLLVTIGQRRPLSQAAFSWGSIIRLAADRLSASPKQEGASRRRRLFYFAVISLAQDFSHLQPQKDDIIRLRLCAHEGANSLLEELYGFRHGEIAIGP